MRILAFGGWGQLGSDLAVVSRGTHEIVRPRHQEIDVTEPDTVFDFVVEARADVVVNAAAFHKVESCEAEPERAFLVNACGALHAGRAARAAGSRYLYVSSDYVFDGNTVGGYVEDDVTAPVNVYGASKAAAEQLVSAASPEAIIVRGSGMFGHAGSAGKGGNFVETMLRKASAGEAISVVDDQVFAPTATHDLAERILLLLERRVPPGTYHGANTGSCSWYQFARAIFDVAGVEAQLSPRSAANNEPVRRPPRSILLDTKSERLGLSPMRPWEEALGWYLRTRPQLSSTSGEPRAPRGDRVGVVPRA